jgi:ketosteroid isomerase-like protein
MGEGWVEILHRVDIAELDFVAGDAEALKSLWSHADEVVVMGAFGGYECGWAAIDARLTWAAANGRPGGFEFETLSQFVGDSLACRVGIQHYGNDRALRVTEVFRKEAEWRLVHRHADWLTPKGAAEVMR